MTMFSISLTKATFCHLYHVDKVNDDVILPKLKTIRGSHCDRLGRFKRVAGEFLHIADSQF